MLREDIAMSLESVCAMQDGEEITATNASRQVPAVSEKDLSSPPPPPPPLDLVLTVPEFDSCDSSSPLTLEDTILAKLECWKRLDLLCAPMCILLVSTPILFYWESRLIVPVSECRMTPSVR